MKYLLLTLTLLLLSGCNYEPDAPYTLRCAKNELSSFSGLSFGVTKYTRYEGGTMITFTNGREILLLPGASCSIEDNKK